MNTHMIGVFVYGALGIAILAAAAVMYGGVYSVLCVAGAAGVAWVSQNFHALGRSDIGGPIAWISAALCLLAAVLTLIGV